MYINRTLGFGASDVGLPTNATSFEMKKSVHLGISICILNETRNILKHTFVRTKFTSVLAVGSKRGK